MKFKVLIPMIALAVCSQTFATNKKSAEQKQAERTCRSETKGMGKKAFKQCVQKKMKQG